MGGCIATKHGIILFVKFTDVIIMGVTIPENQVNWERRVDQMRGIMYLAGTAEEIRTIMTKEEISITLDMGMVADTMTVLRKAAQLNRLLD